MMQQPLQQQHYHSIIPPSLDLTHQNMDTIPQQPIHEPIESQPSEPSQPQESITPSTNNVVENVDKAAVTEDTPKDPEAFNLADAAPFQEMREFYRKGTFCDFDLFCGIDKDNPGGRSVLSEVPIKAHRLILAAGSVNIRQILYLHENDDMEAAIILRDFQRKHVQAAVNILYDRLAGETLETVDESVQEVLDYLDMDLIKPQVVKDAFRVTRSDAEKLRRKRRAIETAEAQNGGAKRVKDLIEPEVKLEEYPAIKEEVNDDDDFVVPDEYDEEDEDEDYYAPSTYRRKTKRERDVDPDEPRQQRTRKNDDKPSKSSRHERATRTMDLGYVRAQIEGHEPDNVLQISRAGRAIAPRLENKGHIGSHLKFLTTRRDSLQILLGVKRDGDTIRGKPIAWSRPGKDNLKPQMDEGVRVFQWLYGLCKIHLLTPRCIYAFQDRPLKDRKKQIDVNDIYKHMSYKSPREELEWLLKSEEIVQAAHEPKPMFQPLELPEDMDWKIHLDFNLEYFDDVMVVGCHEDYVVAKVIDTESAKDKEDLANLCMSVLCLVLAGGTEDSRYPVCQEVHKMYKEMKRNRYRKEYAEKLLASGEKLPKPIPTFPCEICGKVIKENISFTAKTIHMHEHKAEAACNCGITFKSKAAKMDHYNKVHRVWRGPSKSLLNPNRVGGAVKLVNCSECKFVGTEEKLASHYSRYHTKLICELCGKVVKTSREMSHHMSTHKMDTDCDCNIKFKTRKEKREHYWEVHRIRQREGSEDDDDDNTTQCAECTYRGTEEKVNEHFSRSHVEVTCETCLKVIKNSKELNLHIYNCHTPKACKLCGETFLGHTAWYTHSISMHKEQHGITKRTPIDIACNKCPKIFKNKFAFEKHFKQMHGDDSDRPFKCRECDRAFIERAKLAAHRLNVHIKSKPFVCRSPGCTAAFNTAGNMFVHERKLHGQRFPQPVPSITDLVPDYED